jgi:hypothetical protein
MFKDYDIKVCKSRFSLHSYRAFIYLLLIRKSKCEVIFSIIITTAKERFFHGFSLHFTGRNEMDRRDAKETMNWL